MVVNGKLFDVFLATLGATKCTLWQPFQIWHRPMRKLVIWYYKGRDKRCSVQSDDEPPIFQSIHICPADIAIFEVENL